ncbi:MAG: O-antigen ligase family protein [Alphaproteobacteria bacterium]
MPRALNGRPSRLEGLCFWLLAAIVVLAPLPFGSYRPWAWSAICVAVGFLLLLWALAAARKPVVVRIPWRILALPIAVFAALLLWFFFQASSISPASWHHPIWRQAGDALGTDLPGAISLNPEATIAGIMRFAGYAGVFFLALQFGRAPERAHVIVWIVAMAGLAYALYGLALKFSGTNMILWYERWAYPGSLTSTFVNRNSYGTYAGLGAIATLSLMNMAFAQSLERGLRTRAGIIHFLDNLKPSLFFLVAAFVVIATALLFSQSRGAFLASILGIGTLFAMMALRRQNKTGAASGSVVAFFVAAAVLVSFSGSATLNRLGDWVSEGDGRAAIFVLSAHAIAEHPILGWGLGSFRGVFQIMRDSTFPVLVWAYQQAHSSYLELALEAGLPAFTLMMALLAGMVGLCVRGVLRRRRRVIYPAVGLAATALVAAHAAVDFSMQIPAVVVTYLFLMGAACGQSFNTGPETRI